MKNKVDALLHRNPYHLKKELVRTALTKILKDMENDGELFENLLNSFPYRLRAVKVSRAGHADYQIFFSYVFIVVEIKNSLINLNFKASNIYGHIFVGHPVENRIQ